MSLKRHFLTIYLFSSQKTSKFWYNIIQTILNLCFSLNSAYLAGLNFKDRSVASSHIIRKLCTGIALHGSIYLFKELKQPKYLKIISICLARSTVRSAHSNCWQSIGHGSLGSMSQSR